MRNTSLVVLLCVILPVCWIGQGQWNSAIISVDFSHPGAQISTQMFGIFFEDINFGADGGLYPERIKNRSFEFDKPLMGWHQILTMTSGGNNSDKGEMEIDLVRAAESVFRHGLPNSPPVRRNSR